MNRRERNLLQPDTNSQSIVLANWLAVIGDFNSLYNQLSNCLAASAHSPVISAQDPPWVGNCRTTQIKALLSTMHNELEIMLNDADRFENLNTKEGYAQLAIHVTHLRQLNEQAQILLCLASLPTG
ncbi:hypothetical protein [Spirosoma rhododendri]|uniref:Uncharacterized protein n=1 Tax=Spirosoma rhododendri TaxID=2728024 RepID=A0A7L5DVG9_9BACT|nr:hypothetical protein [Spirosoma rhododendri]QJD79957.1 hypothetical protein HH216_17220 [Spirosoma rhododendri]